METLKIILDFIVLIGATFGAVAAIVLGVRKLFLPFDKLKSVQDENAGLKQENKELRALVENKEKEIIERHDRDIRVIKDEQSVIVYGLLASLKGDEESKAKAIDMLEKHLNKAAHEHGGVFE